MKLKIFILIGLGTMLLACSVQKPLKFILLESSKTFAPETNEKVTFFGDSYIIENYKNNNYSINQVDSFAHYLGRIKKESCNSFTITFYKASDITNLIHLKENPRDLDRYSQNNDEIYDYRWSNGIFLGKTKIKNGKIIDPKSRVIIKDAPPLKH